MTNYITPNANYDLFSTALAVTHQNVGLLAPILVPKS